MNDRLVVILVSDDPKVLGIGLMYARNVVKQGWMVDMKLFLFGPSEMRVSTDQNLATQVRKLVAEGTIPQACKWYADKYNISEALSELGCTVAYVGAPISEAIRAAYIPMIW